VAWRATDAHLQILHQLLVAPLEDLLYDASALVFVPHDDLHRLPFHAVHDGRRALLDRWPVSYAPSATAFVRCRQRPPSTATTSLVLGVPDRRAPAIAAEAEAVAARLPAATVLVGDAARGAALDEALGHRFIHIATHGAFREDNPLFSSIRLADQDLTLLDLYRLRLDADLVTLSGCGTGRHAVVGGEELVGLTRGLLSAGARSVLVTLWDVHDASTTELMERFYDGLSTGLPRAAALREAALALRERRPHPFYWAPYTLVGDAGWVRSPSST
jgi:CHAT domain-containing protein